MSPPFETRSVSQTITLCVFTVGLFVVYRLLTLTLVINKNTNHTISLKFAYSAVFIHLVSFLSIVVYFATNASPELLIFSKIMHGVSSVFHLVWIVKVKNRIDALTSAKTNTDTSLNPFLSAFLHVIYFQYKINQRNAGIAELAA
jgi:hypothetical protein